MAVAAAAGEAVVVAVAVEGAAAVAVEEVALAEAAEGWVLDGPTALRYYPYSAFPSRVPIVASP